MPICQYAMLLWPLVSSSFTPCNPLLKLLILFYTTGRKIPCWMKLTVIFYTFLFICSYLFLIYEPCWRKHFFVRFLILNWNIQKNVHFYTILVVFRGLYHFYRSKIKHILIPLIWCTFLLASMCITLWFRGSVLIKFAYKKQTLLDYLMWYAWEDFVFWSPSPNLKW